MKEFEYEPIEGLPELLPAGEYILWQGQPDWKVMARRVFHARAAAFYFAALVVVRGLVAASEGATLGGAVLASLSLVPVGVVLVAVLVGLAYWNARTTIYTITNRRVVLRYGIALTMAVNLPFKQVKSALFKPDKSGAGEIPLEMAGTGNLAFLHLWPHTRPWKYNPTQPMMRCVPEGKKVAELLGDALREAHDQQTAAAASSVESESSERSTPNPMAGFASA
ncbi:MAG TPA: photosynthetic complex putative assembly protein PuhB [Myxococcales bacterium LLY-WYZ-16_1]|nr:photosynthetic complex putative assembly protein PuhB [Myxococcales bacterium LLY-WYZ-16_1]